MTGLKKLVFLFSIMFKFFFGTPYAHNILADLLVNIVPWTHALTSTPCRPLTCCLRLLHRAQFSNKNCKRLKIIYMKGALPTYSLQPVRLR